MKKFKLKTIASSYNPETGISTATVSTEIGIFNGLARLHPDDKEIASKFAGCEYAEMRAILKYAKEKIKIINYQLEPLEKIYNDLKNRKYFKERNTGVRLLQNEIKELKDTRTIIQIQAKNLADTLQKNINTRPDIIKSIQEKKNKKQDN